MPRKLLFLLLILWIISFFSVGFFIGSGRKISFDPSSFNLLKSKKQYKTKIAQPDPQIFKSKKIDSKGGKVSLVDKNGVKIDFLVPAKALDNETEIKISSLPEVPVENFQAGENNPGILVEPVDIRFNIPATVIFDFNPANDVLEVGVIPIPPTTGNESATPNSQTPSQPELSEEEQTRRSNSQTRSFGENESVVHTNSSPTQPGTIVIYSPSETNSERGQIQTQVDGGGSYNVDSEVNKAEARENINNVLDNPNSTPEQILEAASLAQAWGFADLDQKAKVKLQEKIDQAIEQMNSQCREGNGIAKKKIIQWQSLAQALGFDKQEEKIQNLLENCKGYYSFELLIAAEFDMKYTGSVCGFVDDTWEGSLNSVYYPPYSGSCWTTKLSFSFPSGGGYSTAAPHSMTCHACYQGSCATETTQQTASFYYDGVDTISIPGYASSKISFQKNCQNALPPLEPIPVNDNQLPPLIPIPTGT